MTEAREGGAGGSEQGPRGRVAGCAQVDTTSRKLQWVGGLDGRTNLGGRNETGADAAGQSLVVVDRGRSGRSGGGRSLLPLEEQRRRVEGGLFSRSHRPGHGTDTERGRELTEREEGLMGETER